MIFPGFSVVSRLKKIPWQFHKTQEYHPSEHPVNTNVMLVSSPSKKTLEKWFSHSFQFYKKKFEKFEKLWVPLICLNCFYFVTMMLTFDTVSVFSFCGKFISSSTFCTW